MSWRLDPDSDYAYDETNQPDPGPPQVARYDVRLSLTVPIDPDDDPAVYVTPAEQRRLERRILQALRTLDGDQDCEVMAAGIEDEDGRPRRERRR